MTKNVLINGELLGGPYCGGLVQTPLHGPQVLLVQSPDAAGGPVHAYEWAGHASPHNGRWMWRHMHKVGEKLKTEN